MQLTPHQPTPSKSQEDAIRRARGEYLEMPGLCLTEAQARRLWGLDQTSCSLLLQALVDVHFLSRTRDGAFVRTDQLRQAS